MHNSLLKTSLVTLFLITANLALSQDNWQELFNGKNLDGWHQLNGQAKYEVVDNMIVGTTKFGEPNSFLCTDQKYSDFILEFDIWVDTRLNSGVQFRSLSNKDYQNGRVHGYQVEVDPSSRAFTGGIYDEARRAWMYPISLNPKAKSAFRNGEWNTIRVEAIGMHINTWVNGIQASRLVDNMTSSGFIGLQVHGVYSEEHDGIQVKWRNLKIATSNLEDLKTRMDPEVPEQSYLINSLTSVEKRNGWRMLWDGKSSTGWRGAKRSDFPDNGWVIENGVLTIEGSDGAESAGPGDIITSETFSDFILELEFKITEGANSGIKYFVDPEINKGSGSAIGCEFQILDDKKHPDAKLGVAGNRTVASLYDLIPADNISVPGRGKQFKGVGAWNKARIVSKDGIVEHWLNNEKVLEYDRNSQMFRALVAYSKYRDWDGFGQWPEGHILLQDHGNTVHFRSIKIREFN